MAIVKLTKPCFLGTENPRYYPEGSVIDWNGPLNKAMVPVETAEERRGAVKGEDQNDPKVRSRVEAARKRPSDLQKYRATPVVSGKGAEKVMPNWAPEPRPAFSVPHLRDPKTMKPGEDEASVVRTAASPPGAGSHPSVSAEMEAGRLPSHGDRPGEARSDARQVEPHSQQPKRRGRAPRAKK